MPKRSYDPSKRKHAVPPQLRAWVYRRRKRTHDPKRVSMATGYGAVGRKPYRRGSRGGVAWSGGKSLRYDPAQKKGWRHKARGIGGRIEAAFSKYSMPIGAVGMLIAGIKGSYDKYVAANASQGAHNYWVALVGGKASDGSVKMPEIAHLWTVETTAGGFNPLTYLRYKFFGAFEGQTSTWCAPFWVSLATYIVTKFNIIPKRINTPLKGIAKGALLASTIGALALPGTPSGSTTGNPSYTSNPNRAIVYTYQ